MSNFTGEACPFCGGSSYAQKGPAAFSCMGCGRRFTVLRDLGAYWFCEGREMEIEEAMKRFFLGEEQAKQQFPEKPIMISKR